jgi:hypothetical protein
MTEQVSKVRWSKASGAVGMIHRAVVDGVTIEIDPATRNTYTASIIKENGSSSSYDYSRKEWSFKFLKEYLIAEKAHPVTQYK